MPQLSPTEQKRQYSMAKLENGVALTQQAGIITNDAIAVLTDGVNNLSQLFKELCNTHNIVSHFDRSELEKYLEELHQILLTLPYDKKVGGIEEKTTQIACCMIKKGDLMCAKMCFEIQATLSKIRVGLGFNPEPSFSYCDAFLNPRPEYGPQ